MGDVKLIYHLFYLPVDRNRSHPGYPLTRTILPIPSPDGPDGGRKSNHSHASHIVPKGTIRTTTTSPVGVLLVKESVLVSGITNKRQKRLQRARITLFNFHFLHRFPWSIYFDLMKSCLHQPTLQRHRQRLFTSNSLPPLTHRKKTHTQPAPDDWRAASAKLRFLLKASSRSFHTILPFLPLSR